MKVLARAGVAALEGRSEEAVILYREAIDLYDQARFRFSAALTRLLALTLLPGEPAVADWEAEARSFFEFVKSPPLLSLMDAAVASRAGQQA